MPLYEYACSSPQCSYVETKFFTISDPARDEWENGGQFHNHRTTIMGIDTGDEFWPLRRVFTPFASHADPVGDGYYDNSAGAFITSRRQLDDLNARASDEITERTGIPTKLVAHDIREAAEFAKPPDD